MLSTMGPLILVWRLILNENVMVRLIIPTRFKGTEPTESLGVLFFIKDGQSCLYNPYRTSNICNTSGRQAKSRDIDACGLITVAKILSFFLFKNRATRNRVRPTCYEGWFLMCKSRSEARRGRQF